MNRQQFIAGLAILTVVAPPNPANTMYSPTYFEDGDSRVVLTGTWLTDSGTQYGGNNQGTYSPSGATSDMTVTVYSDGTNRLSLKFFGFTNAGDIYITVDGGAVTLFHTVDTVGQDVEYLTPALSVGLHTIRAYRDGTLTGNCIFNRGSFV